MKFEDLCEFELKRGNHEKPEDGLCVLEAVAWFEGEPHSDHPRCVCPVIGHFCRSLNDRLDRRRQDLVPYIPRLANTMGTEEVFRSRLQLLVSEYLALGGSQLLAGRVLKGYAKSRFPVQASSFSLSILSDAITIKRSASYSFKVLDRLLSLGPVSAGFSASVSRRAKDLESVSSR